MISNKLKRMVYERPYCAWDDEFNKMVVEAASFESENEEAPMPKELIDFFKVILHRAHMDAELTSNITEKELKAMYEYLIEEYPIGDDEEWW